MYAHTVRSTAGSSAMLSASPGGRLGLFATGDGWKMGETRPTRVSSFLETQFGVGKKELDGGTYCNDDAKGYFSYVTSTEARLFFFFFDLLPYDGVKPCKTPSVAGTPGSVPLPRYYST